MKILLSKSICFLLSAIFVTFIFADSAQAQTEKKIVKIRSEVAKTNKGVSKYTKTTKDVDGIALEGTQATYYSSAKKVRKITAEMYGETYKTTAEFYYADGELIFAYLKRNQYDTQIGEAKTPNVTLVEEQRYYFADDDLIRLLVGKEELKSDDEKYSKLKDEIISISTKLKDSY